MPRLTVAAAAVAAALVIAAFAAEPGNLPVLRTAANHPVQYYVSLPEGWSADRKWPILLAVDASYGDFYSHAERFAKARKSAPFIVVVPFLTNGREVPAPQRREKYHYSADTWRRIEKEGWLNFDVAALDTVVAEVRAQYGGEGKPFLTGWGQGGTTLVWTLVFTHPERWRAVALACPYFDIGDALKPSQSPERGALPVTVFHGESDFLRVNASLDAHWEKARALADQHSFKVTRVLVKDKYHEPLADDVVAFFSKLAQ